MSDAGALNIHASCVAWEGRAVLITGASGSGKSALALALMAYGCTLVADDRTLLTQSDGAVLCAAPPALFGKVEARFVGILRATALRQATLAMVVDLDREETERLPPERYVSYFDIPCPLIWRSSGGHVGTSVLQFLKAGRSNT